MTAPGSDEQVVSGARCTCGSGIWATGHMSGCELLTPAAPVVQGDEGLREALRDLADELERDERDGIPPNVPLLVEALRALDGGA